MLKESVTGGAWIVLRIASVVILGLFLSTKNAYSIEYGASLGLHVDVPPFMWMDGKSLGSAQLLTEKQRNIWSFQQKNLEQVRAWGGLWNIVTLRQWMDDEKSFPRLRKLIEEHHANGVQIVFRLLEDPGIYQRLAEVESSRFGYESDYYNWVYSLASEFGEQVKYYLIGNEAELDMGKAHHKWLAVWKPDAPDHVRLDYSDYSRLLKTAVKAVKSVDPELNVANSGFSDKSLALVVADEIYRNSGISDAQKFWKDWKSVGGIQVEGRLGLHRLLKDSEVRRRIDFVRSAVREPAGSTVFQLHYYGGWKALQPILDWLDKEMRQAGVKRPIMAAEVGYGIRGNKQKGRDGKVRKIQDWGYYSQQEHVENIVKNISILMGNGVQMALYWRMRTSHIYGHAVRLFPPTDDPNNFEQTPVTRAFRMLGKMLNGAILSPGRMPHRHGVREYRFLGEKDISIVWGNMSSLDSTALSRAELRNINDKRLSLTDARTSKGPVYIYWPYPEPVEAVTDERSIKEEQ